MGSILGVSEQAETLISEMQQQIAEVETKLREVDAKPRVFLYDSEEVTPFTAGGVSSGIDMALRLVMLESGEGLAKAVQLALEYDPAPPVDSGSFHKATPKTIQHSRDLLTANMQPARTDKRE